MAWIPAALSLVGSVINSSAQNKAAKAAAAGANQLSQNESNIDAQLEQLISGITGNAAQYQSVLPQLTSIMKSLGGGAAAQAPGAASSFIGNAMSPSALAGLTGINAGGLTGNALQYLMNPSGTNVGQLTPAMLTQLLNGNTNLASVTPGLNSFYGNEMTQGINPQYAENAQSQIQQNTAQQMADVASQRAPGQNVNAADRAIQNQGLTSATNLAGNLAGESQQFANTGAQGLAATGSALDQQILQRLAQAFQTGQSADTQAAGNLTQGAQLGTNYNQTALGDQQQGATFAQQLLQLLQGYSTAGNGPLQSALSSLGSLGSTYASQASNYANSAASLASGATNPFSSVGSILAANPNMFSGGSNSSGSGMTSPYDLVGASGLTPTLPATPATTAAPVTYAGGNYLTGTGA